MNSYERFGESVRGEQDRACERNRYLAEAAGRRALSWRTPRQRGRWALAVTLPLVAAAAIFAVLWRSHVAAGLAFTAPGGQVGRVGAWIAAPPEGPLPLRFSDGSLVSLYAGSRARVAASDENGARVVIERGGASASVTHRAASRWAFDVGPFEVVVVGTLFDVNWDSDDEIFRLDLHEGSVLVSGPCMQEPRAVGRGHRLRVSCHATHDEIVETSDEADEVSSAPRPNSQLEPPRAAEAGDAAARGGIEAAEGVRVSPAPHLAAPSSSVLESDGWRDLVTTGRYRQALDLVERIGFDEQCRHAAGVDLLQLGDVARFAGSVKRARQAYTAARAKLPGGGRSAYGLGLTAFEQEGDFATAARWFETYLAEQLQGDLRREAQARAMEAWQRAGVPDRARAAAQAYLHQYPSGAQAPLARQLAANP